MENEELHRVLTEIQINVAVIKDNTTDIKFIQEEEKKKVSRLEKHLYWTSGVGACLMFIIGIIKFKIFL